jgi:hypothetical protein
MFSVLLAGLAFPLGAGGRMTMRVSPEVSFAPAHLVVRATVEAAPENRGLEVVAESDDFYRSSTVQLDGEHAPRTSIFDFVSLPGGVYDVTVRLLDVHGGTITEERKQAQVLAGGER